MNLDAKALDLYTLDLPASTAVPFAGVKTLNESAVKKSFGQAVRAARTEAGLSQMELAERADLHFTFISSVERGVRNISLVNIVRIARALAVKPEVLFTNLPTTK
jgi:ribosome-binding protein aMBF1 (putative translation factor)